MLRKLLACLALLTGLAAGHAPVQAKVAVALAASVEAPLACDRAGIAASPRPAVSAPRGVYTATDWLLPPATAPLVASVRLGSDRARE